MTIELRHLRCFLAVAEEGNITRAAQRLHLTQPAVSRTLRQLEQRLGFRLVDRSTHHLLLTPEGHAFRDKAAAALAAVDDALDPARLVPWPLRVGHAWAAFGGHTADLLRRWEQRHPDTPLELLRIDDHTAGLATGRVDVAVLRGPVRATGLATASLPSEERVAAVPTDSPLACRDELTLADLTGEVVAVNPVSGVTTLDLWPPAIRPARSLRVANTDDWLAAIAAHRAVGITTSATRRLHTYPGVAFVPVTGAAPIPVVLAWRRAPGHPAIPDLVALAHEVLGPGRSG
ncbi:DNA-binding transcriptional LysR family regulator [Prauserella shujinwangii]|uniref:DNA-binding transcriptional LysR family regulator n=1 Tax=Prauserella shujinwangii TaxID=1453103 RepID=A0A2T0LQZ0_9PSEU|nr:LysR family transcriptional regulator [Prauserella shujinwangii]PRX45882.1 DNA-binding transcriptional LysR family regulator [Prauserella shujinwangii]